MNEDQLIQINGLCAALFGADSTQRSQAQEQLKFLNSVSSLPHLRFLLERSSDGMCQFFASTTLTGIVVDNWPSLSTEIKQDLRSWILTLLSNRSNQMTPHSLGQVIMLLCRITKMGWQQFESYRRLPSEVIDSIVNQTKSADITDMGLVVLISLVQEMNNNNSNLRATEQLRIRDSFRDEALLDIFQTSVTVLERIKTNPQQGPKICADALSLACNCLSFQFAGLYQDDTIEETTVYLPRTWHSVITERNTIQIFWDLFCNLSTPTSTECMKCLVQLASITGSLFQTYDEYKSWLQKLMEISQMALKQPQLIENSETYHQFCRFLSRIKATRQLSELLNSQSIPEWETLLMQFTLKSFANWKTTCNSHTYILQLWNRLACCDLERLSSFILEVTKAYIFSRLEQAREEAQDPKENELMESDHVIEEVEYMAPLVKLCFDQAGPYILSLLQPMLNEFMNNTQLWQDSVDINNKFSIMECQLAWLVYIVGSITGYEFFLTASEETKIIHSDFAVIVFRLTQPLQVRHNHQRAQESLTLAMLEAGLLYFIRNLSRVYICESRLDSALYMKLREHLGLEDHVAVLDFVVTKLITNLKTWRSSSNIIRETLSVFTEICNGSSRSHLATIPIVKYLLQHHSEFLEGELCGKSRYRFYEAVAFLLCISSIEENSFRQFMSPFLDIIQKLESINEPHQLNQPEVRMAIINVCRDLRGVAAACCTRRTYNYLFDWLYPSHSELFKRLIQYFASDCDVIIPIMKLLAELASNTKQRITFPITSVNGILLYKEMSSWLDLFCQTWFNILPQPMSEDKIYSHKLKGASVAMCMLSRALSGGYCPFPAMAYYKDDSLERSLTNGLKIAGFITLDVLLQYRKVAFSYYEMIAALFATHCHWIVTIETTSFLRLVASLMEVFKSTELRCTESLSNSAAALGHLAAFYFQEKHKNTGASMILSQHFQRYPDFFPRMMATLLTYVLFEECPNVYAMTSVLLSLILTNPSGFMEYRRHVVSSVSPELQQIINESFDHLTEGIGETLDPSNRDKFHVNIITFRNKAPVIRLPTIDPLHISGTPPHSPSVSPILSPPRHLSPAHSPLVAPMAPIIPITPLPFSI